MSAEPRTYPEAEALTPAVLQRTPLPRYESESNKGTRGKLLVVAGSRRLPGTAILVGRAALRSGCGTVRVAAPASVCAAIGVALPELMVLPLPETEQGTIALEALPLLAEQYDPCDAMVVGPGLDQQVQTALLCVHLVTNAPLPMVVDASALEALNIEAQRADDTACGDTACDDTACDDTARNGLPPAGRVYTPHAREMCGLLGLDEDALAAEAVRLTRDFARTRGATLVLKGRETLITDATGTLYANIAGSRALGTAGSGDTLAGIIGSLLAQGLDPTPAAAWGVHLHALAGEMVARDLGEDGVLASDFIERLPLVLRALRTETLGPGA